MRNTWLRDNTLVREGLRELQRRLPPGWRVTPAQGSTDVMAEITAPDRRKGSIALEAKARLDPKGVRVLVEGTRGARAGGPLVVIARYLSEGTRARLRESGVNYLDLTGNVRIVVPRPGLFIETQGASEDPDREERPARSLRGSDRQSDKDALDVLRLLRGTETDDLATRYEKLLADLRSTEAARTGRDLL